MASNNSTNSVITSKLFLTLIGVKTNFFSSSIYYAVTEYKHVHPDFVQLALINLVIPVASAS